ncbi:MAG: ABC transporter ATP-binding protein [Rhodospirillaceae bacterium]|jgi:iron(III) transport system ATP-binding protein|nr:ABC transporter ATP-binding protein [Rhodospirillaceae bacterium]MBT4042649.1 ABC transporter ATP-binding protein [Rhodospirillaceae bacterium]MBT4687543.1 ABC transporter ATP-binding protein [Rhodospirillaceae bacterium]MBT5079644.1 ABC transporter ATP-binding protein [Rhodospirillaceae bacterium]MBT5522682.1 ABC transporter ATP-binding protein [Rhodospirillaceae bacterium]
MQGLHIHGIHHAYGDTDVLNNVSLTVPAGELVCLLGPSGCGKTTLLRIAAGLEKLQAGSISIDESVVAEPGLELPPEDRKIGFMFQDYALFPHLTIRDNVSFGLFRQSKQAARDRAMEMLEQVGLTRHADDYPHMLSGGQQQRVALARALAPAPRLVLLDEPFSGLDSNMRARIRQETLTMLKQTNVATLMVTHDPREAMFMSDRIKVMGANGQVLQSGRPVDIYYKPVDEYVARLFGPVNMIEGPVAGGRLETSFGPVDSEDIPDGQIMRVLIRLEGLSLHYHSGAPTDVPVDVLTAHLLGDSSIVHIRMREGPNKGVEYRARVHGSFDPTAHGQVWARVDPRCIFQYPNPEDGR